MLNPVAGTFYAVYSTVFLLITKNIMVSTINKNDNKLENEIDTCFFGTKLKYQCASDEIRQDIEDAIFRLKPWAHESNPNETVWGGWARMALPLVEFQVFLFQIP